MAQSVQHPKEMMTNEEIRRMTRQFPAQQREVPKVLAPLVALVPDVAQHEIGRSDGTTLAVRQAHDRRNDALANDAFEPDRRIVPPDPVLDVCGGSQLGVEQDPERGGARVGQQRLDPPAVGIHQPLVGVDVGATQSPLAGSRATLRASAKSSFQRWRNRRAPYPRAVSQVASNDPVSTTAISSTTSWIDARHSSPQRVPGRKAQPRPQ